MIVDSRQEKALQCSRDKSAAIKTLEIVKINIGSSGQKFLDSKFGKNQKSTRNMGLSRLQSIFWIT